MTETAELPTWLDAAMTPPRPRPADDSPSEPDAGSDRDGDDPSGDAFPGRDRADRTVLITQRELGVWRSLRRLFSPLTLGAAVAATASAWLVGTFASAPVLARLALPIGGGVYAVFLGGVAARLVAGATRLVKP